MGSGKRNILFVTLGDRTGADLPLLKVANELRLQGHEVQVLVKNKTELNPLVTQLPVKPDYDADINMIIRKDNSRVALKRDVKYLFNTINENTSYQDTNIILDHLKFIPHIIFVGVIYGFLSSDDILRLSQATIAVVYNIAVDMNHFTGGCHFSWECEGYKQGCHTIECPAILDHQFKNLAGKNFLIKQGNVQRGNFKILAGTAWTQKQAEESLIYKNQDRFFNISSAVDMSIYNTRQRHIAKAIFDLHPDKFYILAGAENTQDKRKGYDYFVETINLFWEKLSQDQRQKVEILCVTRILDEEAHGKIKFSKKNISYIKDERLLSCLYQAADVYVNCSVEDSGPAMLMEAAACGTPVVSFDMGAAKEFVLSERTGFVVANKDVKALAGSLERVYGMPGELRLKMGAAGHKLVSETGSLKQAVTVIEDILTYHQEDFQDFEKSVSVAMCTYNGAAFIREQLDSILAQELPPNEIVICDDHSTDDTVNILESYREKYPAIIKVFYNDQQLGAVKNFEQAINLCSGDLIFLCDQDDIWFPHKTASVINIFNRYPNIKAISHNLQICMADRHLTNLTIWDTTGFLHYLRSSYRNKNYLPYTVFFGNVVTGCALCIRKPVNPVSFKSDIPHVIHDYQLAIHYLLEDSIHFHDECLGLYRQHAGQQVGAVLDKVVLHTRAVKMYYELDNPLWNLLYLKKRMAREGIFRYLENYDPSTLKSLYKKARNNNIHNALRPRNWLKQSAFLFNIVLSRVKRLITTSPE
jgi:glycosyltransferase involved in cell wall biosynthesis